LLVEDGNCWTVEKSIEGGGPRESQPPRCAGVSVRGISEAILKVGMGGKREKGDGKRRKELFREVAFEEKGKG